MDISFEKILDCVLNIAQNTLLEKQAKIYEIRKLETSTSDYLVITIKTDDFMVEISTCVGKDEKEYTIEGVSINVAYLKNNWLKGEIIYKLVNRCCVALNGFLPNLTFYKDEVTLCEK